MDEVWTLLAAFVTAPETNTVAQAFAAITALVIGWKAVPFTLAAVPPLSGDSLAQRAARGILALALSLVLAFAAAVAVGMLAQRP